MTRCPHCGAEPYIGGSHYRKNPYSSDTIPVCKIPHAKPASPGYLSLGEAE
ncbi:hypothetical protein PBI_GAIA_123 [Mycobacterium phage Gaia]|uniref:Uncharacterized protein n=1 Tax=Mycobacterium phage Gaia TaxID=1486472 RepID=A0A068F1W9_9CAUD|nr:hypothetical protein VC46_gp110 [Mycobacterium phage Gaia]AID58942.1 hypothetical protein PBI_GAIA_123 [Mycobacterium phage Gaia]